MEWRTGSFFVQHFTLLSEVTGSLPTLPRVGKGRVPDKRKGKREGISTTVGTVSDLTLFYDLALPCLVLS